MPFHAGYVVCHCPSSAVREEDDEIHGVDVVEVKTGSMSMVEKVVGSGGVTTELVAAVVVTDVDSVAGGVVGIAPGVVLLSNTEDELDVVFVVVRDVVVVVDIASDLEAEE